ncbi:MAG: class I SAM-dependent methyltransferase [Gammaproteobacteria bacterium]
MISVNHDERAQQQFVLALNQYVQGTLAEGSRRVCEQRVQPELGIHDLQKNTDRQRLRKRMEQEELHRFWLNLMQTWQDQLWTCVGECVDRQLDDLTAQCLPGDNDLGTLTLNPKLELPVYQLAVDNHSLPGGYHAEIGSNDVRQGAIYAQSANVYLLGRTGARHDYRGQTLMAHILERFGDQQPSKLLDLGCLVGASTFAYGEQFPEAEIHAVDTSAPALRFAHGQAEARGLKVHFSQQDAEHLNHPSQSFDWVVSHALLHETSSAAVKQIFRECFRVLKPGGIMAHIEIPARMEVMSPWEYLRSSYEAFYNQEPFWNGLTEIDLASLAQTAGFTEAAQGFQKTTADGRAGKPGFISIADGKMDLTNWFVMSARRPLS